jgi:AcrR family transcriptional regulator
MGEVAAELGISATGLGKICDRLLIPYPTRGYWGRRQGRAPIAPPSLPPAPAGCESVVTFAGTPAPSRRKRTRLAPETRRVQLMDAAAAMIGAEGLHAVSIKAVAREIGISETSAHGYFPSRTDLLVALARRELHAMDRQRHADIERGYDHSTKITLSTLSYLRYVAEHGALVQTLLNSPEVRAALRAERLVRGDWDIRRNAAALERNGGVAPAVAYGSTVVLTAVCLRAGRLLARRRIDLAAAERLCLSIVNTADRDLHESPAAALDRTQPGEAAPQQTS